jgi:hypothetical protein
MSAVQFTCDRHQRERADCPACQLERRVWTARHEAAHKRHLALLPPVDCDALDTLCASGAKPAKHCRESPLMAESKERS